MHTHRAIILLLPLFLCSCFSDTEEGTTDLLRSGQSGIRVSVELLKNDGGNDTVLPASIVGVLASQNRSVVATDGIDIPDPLEETGDIIGTRADTELINTLVKLLSTDVRALLNQASEREDALDAYSKSLESHAQRGHIRFRSIKDDVEEHEDDKKRLERRVREIRKEINEAISEGNSGRVSTLTDELIEKQKSLAEADVNLIVKEHLIDAYDDILEPIGERLKAIQANRNALIKGVTVVDMPGVEDLELIEYEDGKIRVGTKRRSLF